MMVENHHNYTALLILVYAILILIGAILFTVAHVRVTNTTEYKSGNTKLNSAKNNLIIAYVLGYIAAGMGILLAIIYFGHVAWGIMNEIPHLIIFILLFLLVIVSGIFGFVALSDINGSGIGDKSFITNWIWAAEVLGLLALILLVISGAWRASYVATHVSVVPVTTVMSNSQQEVTFTAPDSTVYEPPSPVVTTMSSAPNYPAPMV
jgi:hypothetical protein